MSLIFWGGPIDGTRFDCPLTPPPYFLLPTDNENEFSIYMFSSVAAKGELNYDFGGYQEIEKELAAQFLEELDQ